MNRKSTDIAVKRCNYETEAQRKRDRRKPMKTWKETLKKCIEYLELMKDLAQNYAQ